MDQTNLGDCVICLDIIKTNNELKIPCSTCLNIKYHQRCLNEYIQRTNHNNSFSCCQCRQPIQTDTNNIYRLNIQRPQIYPLNIQIYLNQNNEQQTNTEIENNNINFELFFQDLYQYLERFYQIRTQLNHLQENENEPYQKFYKIYFFNLFFLLIIDMFVMLIFSNSNKKDLPGFVTSIIAFIFTSVSLLIKRPEIYSQYNATFNEHCIFISSLIQWGTRFCSSIIFILFRFDIQSYCQFIEFVSFTSSIFILFVSFVFIFKCKKNNSIHIHNEEREHYDLEASRN